jgi:hypothetical protein
VRPSGVVVGGVFGEDVAQVLLVADEHSVGAFGSCGAS